MSVQSIKSNRTVMRSCFLSFAILLLLVWSPAAFAQATDPYNNPADEDVTLADFPFEIQALKQGRIIDGSYQYVGWTPVIRGRIVGRTQEGDEVMVALSQNGKLINILFAELKGTDGLSWYEDFEIRGDDDQVLSDFGNITATFKYYSNRDERTTPLGSRKFRVVKLDGNN